MSNNLPFSNEEEYKKFRYQLLVEHQSEPRNQHEEKLFRYLMGACNEIEELQEKLSYVIEWVNETGRINDLQTWLNNRVYRPMIYKTTLASEPEELEDELEIHN